MKYIQLVSFLLFVFFSDAQELQQVGINSKLFNAHAQEKDCWCWAASIQMVLQYNHVVKTQDEIVERAFGRRINGTLPNWGAESEDITKNLNNWQVDVTGRDLVVKASCFRNPPSDEKIIEYLSADQPILISYRASAFSNHAIVITRCTYTESSSGPVIKTITVSDPWPYSAENLRNEGVNHYDYNTFRDKIDYFWIVSSRIKGYTTVSNNTFDLCSNPFCICLQKALKGFDDGFADLKGNQTTETMFRSNIRFPGERSNYISISGTPMYYVSFYRGPDSDSADILYGQLKQNFEGLQLEEGKWNAQGGSVNAGDKFVKFILPSDKMIVLKWIKSGNKYSVQMLIQRKENDF